MQDQTLFKRIAAISAILSAPVTLAATVVLLMAVDFNSEFMSNPAGLITIGAPASEIFRWGSILELGAPTLLLVPAALYLWYWLKPRAPELVTLSTVFGLANLILAAIGALLRATLYPPLMTAYSQAPENQRDVLMAIFQGVTDFTFEGLYALELIFWGIWWLAQPGRRYGDPGDRLPWRRLWMAPESWAPGQARKCVLFGAFLGGLAWHRDLAAR
ncbi:MAG: DUF4386 family protein [Anaerolineales bacterium]